MTENVIETLPDILKNNMCTMKRASLDDTNRVYMCDSLLKVIHFDKVPNEYSKGRGWNGVPKSNDALYIDTYGKWYFIEFKNGKVYKDDIYRKIYDSLIMLWEKEILPDIDFVRDNVNYILVYNGKMYGRIQESPSRTETYNYFGRLSKKEERLFEIEKLEQYLFCETHTYTKELFKEKFIVEKEKEEMENVPQ